jgi:hypothetical protein
MQTIEAIDQIKLESIEVLRNSLAGNPKNCTEAIT